MVTGHVPFEGENNAAVALMHIQGEMISPREYYPDIPTSLEKIILKFLMVMFQNKTDYNLTAMAVL